MSYFSLIWRLQMGTSNPIKPNQSTPFPNVMPDNCDEIKQHESFVRNFNILYE